MEKEEFVLLIRKYLAGNAEPAEEQMLLNYFESFQTDEGWDESVLGNKAAMENILSDRLSASVKSSRNVSRIHFFKTSWFRYAALLILLVGGGVYFLLRHTPPGALRGNQASTNTYKDSNRDIYKDTDGAVLILADGSKVVLDSLGNGVIATKYGARFKLNNGLLSYTSKEAGSTELAYNTMTTPKGKQFQIGLPDGTKVWLNAASSLKFPTAFGAKDRSVEITGEAYFEVAKDKTRPFFVKIKDQSEIEVLGTNFNINSYDDESSVNTTLLEGSVKIRMADNSAHDVILKPGQQAQSTGDKKSASIAVLEKADIGKVMAWKNGFFNFDNASLEEVMRQLARWYDIEVVYEKGIPDIHFVGEMSRHISLPGLIKILEKSEVHFRIEEGRRLVVYP